MTERRRIIKRTETVKGAVGSPRTTHSLDKKEASVTRSGKRIKQDLFIQHFINNRFNVSATCGELGIGRKTYYDWVKNNEDFAEKLAEAVESKFDFIEDALMKKIAQGDIAAIIFAAKNLLQARNYHPDRNIPVIAQNITIYRDEAHVAKMIEVSKMELDYDQLNLPAGHQEALEKSERARRAELGYK